jgi:hypothetical protein
LLVPDEILSPDASDPVLEPSPFGLYIAVDGDTALVSMSAHGPPGRVRVYSRLPTGEWQRRATIVAPNSHSDDEFGSGLALEGEVAVIRGDGGYFVFRRTAAGWINTQLLGQLPGDSFNNQIAFENGIVAIGGPRQGLGETYLYHLHGKKLRRVGKLSASDGVPSDGFGARVALSPSGDTLVVAAATDQDAWSGSVYIFERKGKHWVEQQKLVPDELKSQLFGDGLAIEDDTLIIGAAAEDFGRGAAYVFRRVDHRWYPQQRLQPTLEEYPGDIFAFGNAIAIGPSDVVLGAHFSSLAFVYSRTAQGLSAAGVAAGPTAEVVAMDGLAAWVGSPWRSEVFIYHLSP